MIYVSADGHHHWHLQHVAKYSLWNAGKTAQVAPAQKVGFCLEDSEHVESTVGPGSPVYADNVAPFRHFCQAYNPDATSVYEGISPGWRDLYASNLAFQWVDASNVLPGEYWLREEVNPLGFIKETGGANAPAYATGHTIIPGFDALAQSTSTQEGEATTVTLTSKAWNDSATPRYTIVSEPQHGTLEARSSNQVIYKPAAGYTGHDSFTFSASDPNRPFPRHPSIATGSIEILPAGSRILLAGDATSTYSVGDQTGAGHEEAFQFTAKSTGTVEELEFRTNGVADTGITGVSLGVFADNAGKPGEVLGRATVSGQPATNSWIKATGLSAAVVGGTKYWLVALPLGAGSDYLRYNVAAAVSAGTGNVESTTGGLTALTAESSWGTYNQGPLGFQAIGTASGAASPMTAPTSAASGATTALARPSVMIEGAPSSVIVGTSIQLSALVAHGVSGVTWRASPGSITSSGLYTAPARVPRAGAAVLRAIGAGASDERRIRIAPAASAQPAPGVALAEPLSGSSWRSAVSTPQATEVGGKLIITTAIGQAGRVRLSAYLARKRLGGCVVQTPANRSFTCLLNLAGVPRDASIVVLASLRSAGGILESARAAAPIPPMRMPDLAGVSLWHDGKWSSSLRFECTPLMAGDGLPEASIGSHGLGVPGTSPLAPA